MTDQIKKALAVIQKGSVELISPAELAEKLALKRPLKIKLGADPSAPDLHLGHYVILKKLRQFQELGHEIIFLIGDFTAMIGDPTGRSETRKPLNPDQIKTNAETYQKQIFRILDPQKTRIVYNSHWLSPLVLRDVVKLAANYTVARMLERNDFSERYKKQHDINLVEFLYPLLQGYDSVELKADIEIGGTDQKFNLLVGRTLQKNYGQTPQVIMTMPILEGLDGVQKMSKSLGNYVAINDPAPEMFGKLMSIPDRLMPKYYELLTNLTFDAAAHPMEAKKLLASNIVSTFWEAEAAAAAQEKFEHTFSKRQIPEDIPEFHPPTQLYNAAHSINISVILTRSGLASSNSEALRLIKDGAVEVDGKKITEKNSSLSGEGPHIIKKGKRGFVKVIMSPSGKFIDSKDLIP